MKDFVSIALMASQKVKDDEAKRKEVKKAHEEQQWGNAAKAYNTFHIMIEAFGDKVASFKVDNSSLIDKTPAAIVTDRKGRTFEIFYNPRGLGDLKYNVNTQWTDNIWHTYSVAIDDERVADAFGKWITQD